jgi:ribosomal-protein-alanine N-acetyltransferase
VIVVERLRWWHVADAVALEPRLFAPDDWSLETWLSEAAQPRNDYLVLRDGESTIGVAGLATTSFGEAYVQTIGVRPERHGEGWGARLLAALVARAIARDAQTMGLEVRAGNTAALRLYARAGFAEVGRRRRYYEHSGEDALVLQSLDLEGAVVALGGAPEVRW